MTFPSPIRAVAFDAVGTLIHPVPSVAEIYAREGRKHGSQLNENELISRFQRAFRSQEEVDVGQDHRTSEAREWQRWQAIVAEVFEALPDPLAPLDALWKHFARPDAWACFPDVAECLENLHAHGMICAVASNFDSRLRHIVENLPALRRCSAITIISELGWRKPAPQFFASLLTRLDLSANEVLLVGDDLDIDYQGGSAAGLRTVYLARKPDAPPRLPLNRIHSLGELCDWMRTHEPTEQS